MALEDLARLIAPRRPNLALKILRCFYSKNEGRTLEELMKETGITHERTFQYYITRLKHWGILWTRRRFNAPAIYSLSHKAFHARVDTLLCDPLKNLINFGMWEANEPIRFASAEVRR